MYNGKKTSGHFKGVSNYFNKGDRSKYVGIGLISISIILFFVGMGWISYIIMCTAFPIGLTILLIDSLNKFSDTDIDEFILKEKQSSQDRINELFQAYDIKTQGDNVVVEGYLFDKNALIKQGRDRAIRTAEYVVSHILLTDKHLIIFERRIDILNAHTIDTEQKFNIDDISNIKVVSDLKTFEYKKRTYRVRQSFLIFKYKNEDVQFIVQDSFALDEFLAKIKQNKD